MRWRRWLGLGESGSPLAHSLLIMIGATHLELAIYMLILMRPPTLTDCLWAAGLGYACALIAYTRLQRRALAKA